MSHRKQLAQQKGVPRVLRPPEDIALGGWPVPLLSNKLPRVGEVALAIEGLKFGEQLKLEEAQRRVTEYILSVYRKASIPTINPLKVKQKVEWVSKLVKNRRSDVREDKRFEREHVKGLRKKKVRKWGFKY